MVVVTRQRLHFWWDETLLTPDTRDTEVIRFTETPTPDSAGIRGKCYHLKGHTQEETLF